MIIDYSSCGPLRERFDQDNIESILESGETAIRNYFDGLKQEEVLYKYDYAWGHFKWIEFHSHSTGYGKLIIQ